MTTEADLELILPVLWRFIRGDMPTPTFETWVYAQPSLEAVLGNTLYLDLISTQFSSKDAVDVVTQKLSDFARRWDISRCQCIRVSDLAVIDMGREDAVFRTLERVRDRGGTYWWLHASQCSVCGQGWLIAQEERQNDLFCLRRLSADALKSIRVAGLWPTDFDRYETLLRIGYDSGRSVRFVDPLDSTLYQTLSDIAMSRPGIRISEIASLFNLDLTTAVELARLVVDKAGVEIDFESPAS